MENFLKVATPEEVQYFFSNPSRLEMIKSVVEPDSDSEYAYLAQLYNTRGDKALCNEYLARIKDDSYRVSTMLLINEIVE